MYKKWQMTPNTLAHEVVKLLTFYAQEDKMSHMHQKVA
jgi:hypothetical protein